MRFFLLLLTSCALLLLFPKDGLRAQISDPQPLVYTHAVEIEGAGGPIQFCVHLADTSRSRQIGLMFQDKLPRNRGMLFDHKDSRQLFMWMENTILSLDMVFITKDLKVLSIARRTTPFSRDIISSGGEARYVLEVNAGIADEKGLKAGSTVRIVQEPCGTQ